MFSARRRVLLSEHVSSAVLKRHSLGTLYRPTIRIRYDDAIRPNTNRLFRPLFGTEANTNQIFGTSLMLTIRWALQRHIPSNQNPKVKMVNWSKHGHYLYWLTHFMCFESKWWWWWWRWWKCTLFCAQYVPQIPNWAQWESCIPKRKHSPTPCDRIHIWGIPSIF